MDMNHEVMGPGSLIQLLGANLARPHVHFEPCQLSLSYFSLLDHLIVWWLSQQHVSMIGKMLVPCTSCGPVLSSKPHLAQSQVFTNSIATPWVCPRGGGLHQCLQRAQLQQQAEPQPAGRSSSSNNNPTQTNKNASKLAKLLIEKWCWGAMSLPLLQRLARAAVQDGLVQPLLRCLQEKGSKNKQK